MGGFRDYLWDALPEARVHILTEELHEAERSGDGPDAYRLMSTAFRPVLGGAAERGDLELTRRCIALVERMLASGDPNLADLVRIRVIDRVGLVPELAALYRSYAGPLTREELAAGQADPTYRLPGDPPAAVPPVADGRPDGAARAVRSWLWERVPASRTYLLEAERAEVRATMSLTAMTPQRYVAEAVVRGMVADAVEWAAGNGDPAPSEKAAAALELMLADPAMASLLRPHAAGIAAEVGRNPLLRAYAGPRLGALLGP